MFGGLRKLLGLDHPQHQQMPQKAMHPAQPIQLGGPVQAVDGYSPQGGQVTFQEDPNDTGSYLQPSYQNPQTTQHAFLNVQGQYGGNSPMSQSVLSPNGSQAADPFGWLRNYLR